jgi:methylmalonyl-CoA epimerase
MPIKKLNHVSIAVDNLDQAIAFYRDVLGLELIRRLTLEDRQLDIAFIKAGETELELITPLNADNTVARFLERRGPGLHHLCFEVDDIHAEMVHMADRGAQFVDDLPHPGAVGMVSFIHPSSAHGVLVEINQPPRDEPERPRPEVPY